MREAINVSNRIPEEGTRGALPRLEGSPPFATHADCVAVLLRDPCRLEAIRGAPSRAATLVRGGVSERPKEHASKACEGKPSVGSNPTATANADAVPRGGVSCVSLIPRTPM